ncbi:hypothetical protein D3C81_2026410 [compost metagenome]
MLKVFVVPEEITRFFHRHFQYISDTFTLNFYFKAFFRETEPFAYRTNGFDIGHKLQIGHDDSISRTLLAAGPSRMG